MNLKRALLAAAAVALLPASAFAQSAPAVFDVNVTFTPDTGATTTAFISCNGGVPLEQDKDGLGDGDGVDFVVEEVTATTDCEITGADVAGFSITYTGDGVGGGCSFEDIGGVEAPGGTCRIDYDADDVSYTVSKIWDISGTGGDLLDTTYGVDITCDEEITSAPGGTISNPDDDEWVASFDASGTSNRSFTASVDASNGAPSCGASESVLDSSVESVAVGCGTRTIAIGGSGGCTITNTVFYEGIPTLSQYGLAVMVLLMLGVGFIGFRRFV